jgi:hypothetical protein
MARTNLPVQPIRTHEGAPAKRINAELQLRRTLMACMLWENTFYEDGLSITERLAKLVPLVDPVTVQSMAVEARTKMKLRHAPLMIARIMAYLPNHKGLVADTLAQIIQRPDELTEFLSLYWSAGRCKLSAQVKKGLARAFTKFDEYALAKYNRDNAVKLRDVLFLVHAKPKDAVQAEVWKRLVDGQLAIPDTWEVALSAGGTDKKAIWTRLLSEGKLGALALLRNLRNMEQAGVDRDAIRQGLLNMKTERVLPFRFIAAARYAPALEPELEQAMYRCLGDKVNLPGKTVLLIDVSGSMDHPISNKSDMTRMDAACGLAVLARELSDDIEVYTFSMQLCQVPPRRGFALRDSIVQSQSHEGTYLGTALGGLEQHTTWDRLIVFTDEQSHGVVGSPKCGRNYMVNVATNTHGVGYGPWHHVDGFSEAILDYIMAVEEQ